MVYAEATWMFAWRGQLARLLDWRLEDTCCRLEKKTERNSSMWFHWPPQLQSL